MYIPGRKTDVEIYHNVKEKIYPNGMSKIAVCSRPIYREPDYYAVEPLVNTELESKESKPKNMSNEVRDDNLKRAREKVFDIAYCNDFDYFITWTLDKEKIDRYDPVEVSKKLQTFLKHRVQRNNLKYLVIPEHHKDGAIHMHGLISGNIRLVDSGKTTERGATIYNMPEWSYGYSTVVETDHNTGRIAGYITKYVTKEFRKIFGKFYYAGGPGLVRHAPTVLYDMPYADVNAKEYSVPEAFAAFKYLTREGGNEAD